MASKALQGEGKTPGSRRIWGWLADHKRTPSEEGERAETERGKKLPKVGCGFQNLMINVGYRRKKMRK